MSEPELVQATLYWTQVAAIGQVAGALATAAAAIIALWIAFSERREQVRFIVREMTIVGGGTPQLDVVSFEVTNLSSMRIRVTTLGWRSGWLAHGPDWVRYRWAVQMPAKLGLGVETPFELDPGQNGSMLIPIDHLIRGGAPDDLFGVRNLPLLGERTPAIAGVLYTTRGLQKSVRVTKSLRKSLTSRRIEADDPAV